MNVLEKILEEIEKYTLNAYECDLDNYRGYQTEVVGTFLIMKICLRWSDENSNNFVTQEREV